MTIDKTSGDGSPSSLVVAITVTMNEINHIGTVETNNKNTKPTASKGDILKLTPSLLRFPQRVQISIISLVFNVKALRTSE